jgi:phenylpropionate dioxygenase-like ring-hydroxylating dioxygenase large terminal subunit
MLTGFWYRALPADRVHRNQLYKATLLGSYPCEEQDTFIWVYIPDPGPQGAGFAPPPEAPDPAPQIEKFSAQYNLACLQAEMPVSIDHGIIGLMDPAHGPFVHQAWWWRQRHSIHEKKKISLC